MSARALHSALLVALVALISGCGEELVAATVTQLSDPPLATKADADGIELFGGTGLGIQIAAYTEDPGPGADNTQTCDGSCEGRPEPIDASAVDVVSDGGAIDLFKVEDGVYIVVGVAPGEGTLIVSSSEADGFIEIPVTVVPQK